MCQSTEFVNSSKLFLMLFPSVPESVDNFVVEGLTKHTESIMDICVKRDSANVFSKTGVLLCLGGNDFSLPFSQTLQRFSLLNNET